VPALDNALESRVEYLSEGTMTRERVRQAVQAVKAPVKREHIVAVRLTEPEWKWLRRTAAGQGIPPATLARVLVTAGLEDLENGK
jgi:predicted transcriptional regulator